MKRVFTLLFIISLIISACTKADSTAAPTAEKAEGGIAGDVNPTVAVAPASSGPPIERMPGGKFVYISQIQMLNVTLGWGVSRVEGGDDHVMRTFDSGQSWVDRTPPEAASAKGKIKHAHLYFSSMEKGFVIYFPEEPGNQPMIIWSTQGSGETWTASEALETQDLEAGAFEFQNLTFVDENTGWLILTTDPGAGQSPAVIFQTTNGGEKWVRILDPKSSNAGSLNNCCMTGALFQDEKTGIATSSVAAYPAAHVNWTKDGGKSWTTQDLPVADEKVFANSMCATESPQAITGGTLLVVVNCVEYVGMTQKHTPYLYFTTDQGANWKFLPMPTTPYAEGKWDSLKRNNVIFFADASNGLFFTQDHYISSTKQLETKNQIFQTTDGGQTWAKINRAAWIGQFSFISAQTAFCAGMNNNGYLLVKTSDGGLNWSYLTPKSAE